jgi:hypothetical protein
VTTLRSSYRSATFPTVGLFHETVVECFREEAPTTAAAAATTILDGVKADPWRILVGDDAHRLDDLVRRSLEQAYDVDFFARPAGITARGAGGER